MAMSLLSSLPVPSIHHHHVHRRHFFRKQSSALLKQRECKLEERVVGCSCASSSSPKFRQQIGFCRRDLMLSALSSSLTTAFPFSGYLAKEEDLKMASLVDEINAYTYLYPVELPSKKFLFKWVESRKPERYSSAAPLSRKFSSFAI
uniref:PsbP domain-containing protein 5ic n=1 Tax=Rhizophora mucronata TaxID=61149 RepID=A0A2P2LD16_RHIMU